MSVIVHPLLAEQVNGRLYQAILNELFEGFKVFVIEENRVASITTVERPVNQASGF